MDLRLSRRRAGGSPVRHAWLAPAVAAAVSLGAWPGRAGAHAPAVREPPAIVAAPSGDTGGPRIIPDTTMPARPVLPSYPVHDELEHLQLMARADTDSAAVALERFVAAHPDATAARLEALYSLGAAYIFLQRGADTERVAGELDTLSARMPMARAAAMLLRAGWLRTQNETARAERLLIEASLQLGNDAPLFLRLAWHVGMAAVRRHTGHYDEALKRYHEALLLAEAGGAPPWRRIDLQIGLANVLGEAGQADKARDVLDQVEREASDARDEEGLSVVDNLRAVLMGDGANDSAAALHAWLGAIEHARLAGDRRGFELNLADLADYYLSRGDYATAIEVSRRALPLARAVHDDDTESVALGNIGLSLIATHHKDEGLSYVRQSAAIDDRHASTSELAANTLELGTYLERAGYLQDALRAYRQYRQLEADAGVKDQQHAVLELQESFANAQRQHELDMLSRENRLKDEALRHHDLEVREWTAAGIAGLLMVAVLGTLARRLRARNQQLSLSNEALRVQAERDPLTGLANRHYLQTTMAARAAQRGLEGTLYLVDVDHFKHINDRCGHAGGDAVLVEIARRLRETLRGDDLVVRWGGEEFLVVVKPMPIGEAEALAQRLLACLAERPVDFDGQAIPVSASIGYAQFPLPGSGLAVDWERAISLVDTAMYLSKAHGRNCACGVRRVDPVSAARLDVLAQTLETAWREGRAELHLQYGPLVDNAPPVAGGADRAAGAGRAAASQEAMQ